MNTNYFSLESFLTTQPLTVDGVVDDGWGGDVVVKGRELDATVLFADISNFTERTSELDPTEVLVFVNHFFTWITEEALRDSPGVVDKYIGDEVMIVFSEEFGSEQPLADALRAAVRMADNDAFAFAPHVGIASGPAIIGYVGTSLYQDCSVFGAPVVLAARCADVSPETDRSYSASITLPEEEWSDSVFDAAYTPAQVPQSGGGSAEDQSWNVLPPRQADLKNLGSVELRHVIREGFWIPGITAQDRAREAVQTIEEAGRRWHVAGDADSP